MSTYDLYRTELSLHDSFPLSTLDWGYVLGLLVVHRLGPTAYVALRDDDSISDLPSVVSRWLHHLHRTAVIRHKLIPPVAARITRALDKQGLRHCYLKGPILQAQHYGRLIRHYDDLDLLVSPNDLSSVTQILESMGFIQGWLRDDRIVPCTRREQLAARLNSHELVPFFTNTASDSVPHIGIDVQFELPGTKLFDLEFDIETLLSSHIVTHISGQDLPTLRPEHHLVLLCTHQRMHALIPDEIKDANDIVLLRFSDLLRAMRAATLADLWRQIVNFAVSGNAIDCLLYCLSQLSRLYRQPSVRQIIADTRSAIARYLDVVEPFPGAIEHHSPAYVKHVFEVTARIPNIRAK